MIKVEKNGITKEIDTERLAADYVSAGWKKVDDKKKEEAKEVKPNPLDKKESK